MRGLKFLVIFLGVVLLAGLVLLGVLIAKRSPSTPGGDRGTATTGAFGPLTHALPQGARVAESEIQGDRLVLRLTLKDGATRILILSLKDGALLGTIALSP